MQEDGYLYLAGLLDVQLVWQSRREICDRLASDGCLQSGYPAMAAIAKPGIVMNLHPDLVRTSPMLKKLLYEGCMMDFYQKFLGADVRHFDYTWTRAVAPGQGTHPHCDVVYMGRGTPNLYASWTPLGNISPKMGGLMILEKSHQLESIRNRYCRMDVDSYCTNRINARLYASGQRTWNGVLTTNPVSFRQRYGGRWLTSRFRAGDVLIFGMFTIHASLDNHSRQFRISSDSRYQLSSEPIDERWIGNSPIGHSLKAKYGYAC